MKLIVGLGNPGSEYEQTRHNMGFLALDAFVAANAFPAWHAERKVHGEISRGIVVDISVLLLKPDTFMNASGSAVAAALSYYKIPVTDLFVVHDEIAFPFGTIRIAGKGSSGGHNGIDSIITALGTELFTRIRVGIGPQDGKMPQLTSFVLNRFSKEEAPALHKVLTKTIETLDKTITLGVAQAMQEQNTKE
ncbi:aminoacyl-tRNA hydrolase [Patescibacteria group bacterium]|nr:aminoacyl-tRNA hydrolase [Patescibacteria group bacterium]